MASSRRRATSSISSRRTTAKVEAVNPCLREFWAERALPSGERGPVDWAALARLAASCLSERGLVMWGPSDLRDSIRRGWSLKLEWGKLWEGKGLSFYCWRQWGARPSFARMHKAEPY